MKYATDLNSIRYQLLPQHVSYELTFCDVLF